MPSKLEIISRNNVRVIGGGDRAIVFVHGFGCDRAMWRYVAPAFTEDYQTVVFDLVGSGKSDLGAFDLERYDCLNGYARDISEVIGVLNLKDLVMQCADDAIAPDTVGEYVHQHFPQV